MSRVRIATSTLVHGVALAVNTLLIGISHLGVLELMACRGSVGYGWFKVNAPREANSSITPGNFSFVR
ncbi:hypothetical protein GSI_11972 [Ganoderma sinense ZZ0214-1]|uniref:Uncharacterized protein n=1 Tax=Ganoderma sinense ZZ0214-1 TaxID=1077348 RepID=A0A2G8RXK6_9APHY|nr:hypothetical protein GSI_11972 [Ganoderma sinense ZZ0214-1]